MGLVLALILLGILFLVLGLVVKALKFLIIVAVVVWVIGLIRGFASRRSG